MDFLNRNILILVILTIGASMVHSACICNETQPQPPIWEAPCGFKIANEDFDVDEPAMDPKVRRAQIMKSVRDIRPSLRLCLHFYKTHNYTKKNNDLVQKSLTIFQDDWLPTSEQVQKIKIEHVKEIPKVELTMYSMLQKYAMLFKEMLDDDHDTAKQKYAKKVMENLKSLLCEVQSTLITLQEKPIGAPEGIPQRYLFTQNTEIHLRDIEVIWKYGEFLKEWKKWIRNIRKQFRKNHKKNRQN